MQILWLPHGPLHRGRSRSDHLIERLAANHRISVVSFKVHDSTRLWRYASDLVMHRSTDGDLYREVATWRFPRAVALNGRIVHGVLRRELAQGGYDVLVAAPAPYITGDPRLQDLRKYVPVVCDYLDGGCWSTEWPQTEFERAYVRAADAVVCVSRGLTSQAAQLNRNSHYIPNGVELGRYRDYTRTHTPEQCKRTIGIEPDTFVVSIIGITCSPTLYFADAVLSLAEKGRKILLLLVGEGQLVERIAERFSSRPDALRICGPIPYTEILPYFMASDVGLNLVDDIPYYHFQSPLKIFEYGAMGKPVLVAPKLDEVELAGLPFVRFCEPTAQSVQDGLDALLEARCVFTDTAIQALERFDWGRIAADFEGVLQNVRRSMDVTVTRREFGLGLAG